MGDFDIGFQQELARQSWSLYSIGMFLIVVRLIGRARLVGIKGLQVDDYLMVLVGGLYTMLVVCLNVISQGGGSNLYLPDEFDTFTPEEIQERIKGSKIVIVSEQAMLNVIYCIKSCMLIMYSRLTLGLKEQRAVKYLAIYVACGWVGSEFAFFFACRPFDGYWAMPPPNPQCTTLQHYAITQGTFNISSDCLMLMIPLPLIIRMAVPWKQKIVLCIIFGMGTFVILAAILTKVFNLSNVWDPSYMLWYTREASVAVYVSNLPMIWPLLRQWFPCLRDMTPGNQPRSTPKPGASGYASNGYAPSSVTGIKSGKASFVKRLSDGMASGMGKGGARANMSELDSGDEMAYINSEGSRDQIHKIDERPSWTAERGGSGGITKSTTVRVVEERTQGQGVPFDFGEDVEKGQQKWDWEQDGGNNYTARVAPAGVERSGRLSESDNGVTCGNSVSRRKRSRSRNDVPVERTITAPRATYARRDTDDEQLSRF